MQSQNKIKIVYSLKIHTELQLLGFEYLGTMPNPRNEKLVCQIYKATPAFLKAFDKLVGGGENG